MNAKVSVIVPLYNKKDYVKFVKEGKIDQLCKEGGELGWLALTKSLKVKEVAGKREMHVQLRLVDPDSEEAKALP